MVSLNRVSLACLAVVIGSVWTDQVANAQYRPMRRPSAAPIKTGFLFINGTYVAPPYEFTVGGGQVRVNTIAIDVSDAGYGESEFSQGLYGRFSTQALMTSQQASDALSEGGVVLIKQGDPIFTSLPEESLAIVRHLTKNAEARSASDFVLFGASKACIEWLKTYEPTELLRERVESESQRIDFTSNRAESESIKGMHFARAVNRLDDSMYPMAVVGMLLVTASSWHILAGRPITATDGVGVGSSSSLVVRSLMLVSAQATLDLVWTIFTYQAGVMSETNPIAAQLIDTPNALIAFKCAATLLSIGLLFALRRHYLAQQAAWACLVLCTLITIRWLTVNSVLLA